MPTYAYTCTQCGAQLEKLQKMSDAPLLQCEKCGHDTLKRGPGGGVGFHLQGEGWYRPASSNSSEKDGSCCPCGKSECD